jgi:hypothetical protein
MPAKSQHAIVTAMGCARNTMGALSIPAAKML